MKTAQDLVADRFLLTGTVFFDFAAVFLVGAAVRFTAGFCADAFFVAPFGADAFFAAGFFVGFAAIRSLTLYLYLVYCSYRTKCPMTEITPTVKQ